MKIKKVWLVLGDKDGLGPSSIKYLMANNQFIIVLLNDKGLTGNDELPLSQNIYFINTEGKKMKNVANALHILTSKLGKIDFIINNYAYSLMDDLNAINVGDQNTFIQGVAAQNILLLGVVMPFLHLDGKSKLINLPPRFCHLEHNDTDAACRIIEERAHFLRNLYEEMGKLNLQLVKIEPGEPFQLD